MRRKRESTSRWVRKAPGPPRPTKCAVCGQPRPKNPKAPDFMDGFAPLNGTWWDVRGNELTCSPYCRLLGGHPEGPYDSLLETNDGQRRP